MIAIFFFWIPLFLILSSYFGYPLILFVLARIFDKEPKKADITPSVSLLVPAYNEEKVIAEKLENCLALDYPKDKLEIIIASESNDKTNEIILTYKEKAVKLFAYKEREGPSALIYKIVPRCQGEIIIFTDANSILAKDALRKLVRNFADLKVGCVCGELKYLNPQKTAIGQSEGLYWKYEIFLKKLESKLSSVLGANGSIYGLRKEFYSPLSKERGSDFELSIRAKQQGCKVVFEKEAFSLEEVSQKPSQEFKRKSRIVSQFFQSSLILLKKSFSPFRPFLIFQLIFHKILRWLGPLFLILIFLSNIFLMDKLFYKFTIVGQIWFYGIALFAYSQEKQRRKSNIIFNLIYYFCIVNLALLIGLVKVIFGKQKFYWEKVR